MSTKHLLFLSLFFIVLLVSFLINAPVNSYGDLLSNFRTHYINPLTGLLVIIFFIKESKQVLNLFLMMAISFLINNTFAIYQYMEGMHRVYGLTAHYMTMAGILLILFFSVFILAVQKKYLSQYRYLFITSCIIALPAIVYNGTRAVWIGVFFLIFFVSFQLFKNKGVSYALIILLFLSSAIYQNDYFRARADTIFDMQYQSNSERLLMWDSAWNMFKDHPIIGVGVGQYQLYYYEQYIHAESIEKLGHAHNVPLQLLAESGLIGFLSYCLLFSYILFESYKQWYREKDAIGLLMFTITMAFLWQGLTEVNLGNQLGITQVYWTILGMYLILTKAVTHKAKE